MTHRLLLLALFAVAGTTARAHVTLPPGGATAGSDYPAAFRVGHACEGAQATTAIRVRIPTGFTPLEAEPRPGWKTTLTPTEVAWEADTPEAALPAKARTRFVVRGRLAATTGTLWFKVLQVCDKGRADWVEIPASAGDKPGFPAARLEVLPPGMAPVDVRDAWARSTVAGQSATGVFARLTAGAGARLVGASSPWAQAVEIHEMKLEGDIMRMREVPGGLELPPGDEFELRPGGHHLMVLGLQRALADGEALPIVLRFVDREGRTSQRQLSVPVRAAGAAPAGEHRHASP